MTGGGGEKKPFPAELVVKAPRGVLPANRAGMRHGFHSSDVVEIPTSLTCSVCPLYHLKRKNKRHKLACPEGRKNQICPILTERQMRWVEEHLAEVREATGDGPSASDRARIEQIVRHRSRIFQVENFLKVAGLIDLRKGETRNVSDRLTTLENALSRSLSEYRQSIESRRQQKPQAPTLAEYLEIRDEGDGNKDD